MQEVVAATKEQIDMILGRQLLCVCNLKNIFMGNHG
jgi:hypothetical protein